MIRIKIPISQQGNAVTYLCSNSKLYHDGQQSIEIYYWQQTEQPGVPTEPGAERKMIVDDTTRLPAVTPEGVPVTQLVERQKRDENGNLMYAQVTDPATGETYTDYSQPVYEQVEEPRTVGEYAAVLWWHFDARNPVHQPSIEEMITEGILRRIGASSQPYEFVITPEFTAAFGPAIC